MTDTEQLNSLLRDQYKLLDSVGTVEIEPSELADLVYRQIDSQTVAPHLVQMAARLELRQLARAVCRYLNTEAAEGTEGASLFDMQLQRRYPTDREGRNPYVLRDHLTLEERHQNIERLRKEANAKLAHADALEAETEELVRRGVLTAVVV